MRDSFIAVYEDGILKPLTPVDFKEHEKVNLKVVNEKSTVLETKGMVKGNPKFIKEVAESKEFDEWNL
ncbi:MAG: antitoxin family protein [Gemmatimonadota bacterium]|nr:MAG: antitoxin family protein [Gemmatimonadota bacterium]